MTPHTVTGDLANFNQEKTSKRATVAVRSRGRGGRKRVCVSGAEPPFSYVGVSLFSSEVGLAHNFRGVQSVA